MTRSKWQEEIRNRQEKMCRYTGRLQLTPSITQTRSNLSTSVFLIRYHRLLAKHNTFGDRRFAAADPRVWNNQLRTIERTTLLETGFTDYGAPWLLAFIYKCALEIFLLTYLTWNHIQIRHVECSTRQTAEARQSGLCRNVTAVYHDRRQYCGGSVDSNWYHTRAGTHHGQVPASLPADRWPSQ